MYHAGWAWAGGAPYQYTKLIASHFGGTRNPLAVRWPAKIKADARPRAQFLHVNDVVPTIYDILGITPPSVVNGIPQDPFDGVSFTSTFNDAKAKEVSRPSISRSWAAAPSTTTAGWRPPLARAPPGYPACPRGPRMDPRQGQVGALQPRGGLVAGQRPGRQDAGEAGGHERPVPDRVHRESRLAGRRRTLGAVFHPELRAKPPYTAWTFPGAITRMPEFAAPALGNTPNVVTLDAEVPANANGVLYALGGFSGGLSLYVKRRHPLLRIQPVRDPAHHHQGQGQAPRRQGQDRGRDGPCRTQARGSAQGVLKVNGQRSRLGRGAGQRAAWVLLPTTGSTSASTSARRSGLSTTTRRRSSSTAGSSRRTWNTPSSGRRNRARVGCNPASRSTARIALDA